MPLIVTQHPHIALAIAVAIGMLLITKLITPTQGRYPTFAQDNKHVARGIELGMGHGR